MRLAASGNWRGFTAGAEWTERPGDDGEARQERSGWEGRGLARKGAAGGERCGVEGFGAERQEWIASVGKRTERRRSVWLGRSGVECGREEGTGKAWQARQWLVTRRLARTRKERQGRKAGIGWVWKGAAGTASLGRAWLGAEGRGRQFNRR